MTVEELKKIPEGEKIPFEATLLLKKVSARIARNGAEFLMVELADRTGSFGVTCFNDSLEYKYFKQAKEGSIQMVEGQSDHYQSRFSPKILQINEISEEEASQQGLMSQLVEVAPEAPEALLTELYGYIENIQDEALRSTVILALESIKDNFIACPGAIAMHHAYRHGLLEHTVHVTRAAKALLPLYPEVDADLAIAGAILHDTGKVIEYEGHLATHKSTTGILQGHVVLGYRIARKAAMQSKLDSKKLELLEHIILSHQGELEWGAAVMAATPEAVFVSMVDNLDAKMGMVQQALRQTPEENECSSYMPGLKSAVFTKA